MAIEIIPKTKKASFLGILFYFSLLLFLAFLISYFALNVYQKRLEQEITNIKKDLEKTPDEKALEEEIFGSEKNVGYQQKIKDFGVLFNDHKLPVNFFNFLEENTHPKVWFSKFNSIASRFIDLLVLTKTIPPFFRLIRDFETAVGETFKFLAISLRLKFIPAFMHKNLNILC